MTLNVFPSLTILEKNKSDLYHINMIYDADVNESVPVITFIAEENQPIHDLDEYGLTGSELVKNAFKNLGTVELDWQEVSEGGGTFLMIDQQKYASEKILDKDFLKKAAERLGTAAILVGIPVQDSIMCCKADDTDSVAALNNKISDFYNDYSRKQISKLIFEVKEGSIISNRPVLTRTATARPLTDFPAGYENNVVKMRLYGDLFSVKVQVSAETMGDLLNGLYIDIHNAILAHRKDRNFTGAIDLQSEYDKPEKTNANVQSVREFLKRLQENPSIKELVKSTNEPIKISFLFGKDFRKGDVHKKIKIILTRS